MRKDSSVTVTGEMLENMPYTRMVVKEILRYRPPAPMVPQVRKECNNNNNNNNNNNDNNNNNNNNHLLQPNKLIIK